MRYRNQNGLFVLYPEPRNDNFSHISTKFVIAAEAKKNILNKLLKIGFNLSFIKHHNELRMSLWCIFFM